MNRWLKSLRDSQGILEQIWDILTGKGYCLAWYFFMQYGDFCRQLRSTSRINFSEQLIKFIINELGYHSSYTVQKEDSISHLFF